MISHDRIFPIIPLKSLCLILKSPVGQRNQPARFGQATALNPALKSDQTGVPRPFCKGKMEPSYQVYSLLSWCFLTYFKSSTWSLRWMSAVRNCFFGNSDDSFVVNIYAIWSKRGFTETHQSALLGHTWLIRKKKMIVCRSHGTPQINSPSPRCLLFQWTLILIQHLSVATYESWQISPLKLPYVPTKWACKHASKFHVLRITYPLGIFNITNYTCMYSKLFFSIGDCTMFRGKL